LPRVRKFDRLRRWTRRGHLGEMPLPSPAGEAIMAVGKDSGKKK
jgi:hypothetical protein